MGLGLWVLSDMPQHTASAAVMAVIVYPMAGLRMGLGLWVLINVGGVLVGAAMMQAAGALSRTFEEANILIMVILMMSMILSSVFVRETPVWLEWARELSIMGLLGDICSYLEFRDVEGLKIEGIDSLEDISAQFGLLVTTEEDMKGACWTLMVIYLIARVIAFLGVKFLYTGKSFGKTRGHEMGPQICRQICMMVCSFCLAGQHFACNAPIVSSVMDFVCG